MNICKWLLAAALAACLCACGGGSSGGGVSAQATAAAAGLYAGSINDGRALQVIVLSNGQYWGLYTAGAGSQVVGGAFEGDLQAATDGSFSSSNGRDFNLEGLGVNDFSTHGDFNPQYFIEGQLQYPGGLARSYSGAFVPDWNDKPSLSVIAGTYSGTDATAAGVENATVVISASGSVTATGDSGCQVTGTVSPRTDGNVYDVSLTQQASCPLVGLHTTGIAYYDGDSGQLYSFSLSSDRSVGVVFSGMRAP